MLVMNNLIKADQAAFMCMLSLAVGRIAFDAIGNPLDLHFVGYPQGN